MNESELIRRLKEGDKAVMRSFQERFQPEIIRYLWKVTGDLETANELWTDVCLCVFRKIANFDTRSQNSFVAWVRRIAYNSAVDEFRRQKRKVSTQSLTPELEAHLPAPCNESATLEVEDAYGSIFRESLAALPLRYREMLLARATFSNRADIATILNEPADLLSVKLNQAAKALLTQIRQHPRMNQTGVEPPIHTELLKRLKNLTNLASEEAITSEATS